MAELSRISALPPCEWQLGSLMPRDHYAHLAAEWLKYPGHIGALPGDMRRQIESYFVQTTVDMDEHSASATTTIMGIVHSFGNNPAYVKVTPSRLYARWYNLGTLLQSNPYVLVKARGDRQYSQSIGGMAKIIIPRRQATFHEKSRVVEKSSAKFNKVYKPLKELAIKYLLRHAPDADHILAMHWRPCVSFFNHKSCNLIARHSRSNCCT